MADSDPESREWATRTLNQHNCRVSTARNGDEALHMVRRERPDGIIFDVELDATSGTLFYARLRRSPDLRGIPCLVHSQVTPRYGTGIPTLRKTGDAARLAHAVRKAFLPQAFRTA